MTTAPELEPTHLTIKWSVSRGRETYGWNICSLRDDVTGTRVRCMGGGYDMIGTVLADWASATHADRLATIAHRAHGEFRPGEGYVRTDDRDALYGMSVIVGDDGSRRVSLDGACGVESIRRILAAAGIHTRATLTPRGQTSGFMVTIGDPA